MSTTEKKRMLKKQHAKDRGMALLVVLLTLAMIAPVVADFQFNSHVDYQIAINGRDSLQAEYNAMSALRLRGLLLKHTKKLERGLSALTGLLGLDPGTLPIGALLEKLPVECGLLGTVLAEVEPSLDDDEGEFFQGSCIATAQSEHSKIPLNMVGSTSGDRQLKVAQRLYGVLSSTAMERHFDEDDANGQHAEKPEDLVAAIIDWVDANDEEAFSGLGDEERPYSSLDEPYRPKNAPFDSLDEVQMVYGIDDEIFSILKDQISIYVDSVQIDLNAANEEQIFAGLAAALPDGVNPSVLLDNPGSFARFLVQLREVRALTFGVIKVEVLAALVQDSGLSSVVDMAKIPQIFTDRSSPIWYRIQASGRYGNVTRNINAVFQANEGRFYYFRTE